MVNLTSFTLSGTSEEGEVERLSHSSENVLAEIRGNDLRA